LPRSRRKRLIRLSLRTPAHLLSLCVSFRCSVIGKLSLVGVSRRPTVPLRGEETEVGHLGERSQSCRTRVKPMPRIWSTEVSSVLASMKSSSALLRHS
jgi:hypothetical protein